jgi:DNA polymerase-3 subunit epsilon
VTFFVKTIYKFQRQIITRFVNDRHLAPDYIMNEFPNFSFDTSTVVTANAAIPSDQWRLLLRLAIPNKFNQPDGRSVKRGLALDVEATGLSLENDDVIQLAMLPFDYDPSDGRITDVHKELSFEGFREPSQPISEEASIITGITDQMVSGQSIDETKVRLIVEQSDLIFAHNAFFDRVMVEKHWPCFSKKPWACTFKSIDWLREGFSAGKLDHLGMQFGWFYDGHTALADCEACLALLAQTLPKSGRRVLEVVREVAQQTEHLICAIDAPFDEKDTLRDRGYRWRPAELKNGKVWWTTCLDREAEIEWLQSEIYRYEKDIPTQEVTALSRYSNRLWDF